MPRGCSLPACTRRECRVQVLRNWTMTDEEQQPAASTNLERLQEHLAKDSLAERLVAAAVTVGDSLLLPALRQVIADRLEEIKRKHEPVPD